MPGLSASGRVDGGERRRRGVFFFAAAVCSNFASYFIFNLQPTAGADYRFIRLLIHGPPRERLLIHGPPRERVACRKASHAFAPSHSQCHFCHQLQLQGGSPEFRSIPSVMVRVNLLARLPHHLMRVGRLCIREESGQCVLIPGVPRTVVSSFEPMGVRLTLRQQRIWLLLKCGGL